MGRIVRRGPDATGEPLRLFPDGGLEFCGNQTGDGPTVIRDPVAGFIVATPAGGRGYWATLKFFTSSRVP